MDRWPSYVFGNQRNTSENQKVMSLDRVSTVRKLDNATGWWLLCGALVALLSTARAAWQQRVIEAQLPCDCACPRL